MYNSRTRTIDPELCNVISKGLKDGILQWLCVSMGRTICACHGQRPISVCRPHLLILWGCELNKQSDPVVIGLLTSANSGKKDEGHAQAGNYSLSIYQTL